MKTVLGYEFYILSKKNIHDNVHTIGAIHRLYVDSIFLRQK
jgi:hypothetical protein